MAQLAAANRKSTDLKQREAFFVTCAPGIEHLLHAELRELRLSKLERQVGGVYFEGTLSDAMRANLWVRTGVRVLMRVARFEALDAERLYSGASAVDWSRFLRPDGSFVVDAHSKDSILDHTLFIEQKLKDAVVDQLRRPDGARPSVAKDDAELGIHVHLFRDRCTLLVDTSGESLHKRGWRRFQGRAPLAETLAAAMVLQSGWDRRAPLLDPFCGSATILIEAALIAGNVAPGLFRPRFGFQRWPGYVEEPWNALLTQARAAQRFASKLILHGGDLDPAVLAGAAENVEAAGLQGRIQLERADATRLEPRRGWNAWIITNPPYGERIGDERALELCYRRLGEILNERCAGYHVTLLSGNPRLARALELRPDRTLSWKNGALDCELLQFDP